MCAASIVSSKTPSTPRNESWVLADAPSRDSETALAPASYSSTRTSRVSRSVTEGDRAMLRPSLLPCATSSGRSGRSKGSPPVRTTSGRGVPNEARSSNSRRPSSVVSSKGLRVRMASARQWVHTSWQARVTSQMTMKGRSDTSWCMRRTGRAWTTVMTYLASSGAAVRPVPAQRTHDGNHPADAADDHADEEPQEHWVELTDAARGAHHGTAEESGEGGENGQSTADDY